MGFQLSERYRLLQTIGSGGEGTVYLVHDLYRGEVLQALKLLKSDAGDSPPAEFKRLLQLRHRSLARVFDTGTIADDEGTRRSFFTTEYFPGEPMTHLSPFSWELFENLLAELLRVLVYLNHAGVCHGDLKPAHVLYTLRPRHEMRVIDLGAAAPLAPNFVDQSPRGTWPYTAPEIWEGTPPSKTSDIYSVGMIALECLCGSLPMTGGAAEWRRWHATGDRNNALQRCVHPPPSRLRNFVLSALSPSPADRPLDAEALVATLRVSEDFWESRDTPPQFVGREQLVAGLRDWITAAGTTSEDARLFCGPPGIGKTRLLSVAAGLARFHGIPVFEIAADNAAGGLSAESIQQAERFLGGAYERSLLIVDDLPPDLAMGRQNVARWFAGLRESLRLVAAKCLIGLRSSGSSFSPRVVMQQFEAHGLRVSVEMLPPLSRAASDQLAYECQVDRSASSLNGDRTKTQGIPARIIAAALGVPNRTGGDVADLPQSTELQQLSPLLRAIPARMPLSVLLAALDWSAEQFWQIASAPAANSLLHFEGTYPDLWLAPTVAESALANSAAPNLGPTLRRLAEIWEAKIGSDAAWIASFLRAEADGNQAAARELRANLRSTHRWRELEGTCLAGDGRNPIQRSEKWWDWLAALFHTGRAAQAAEHLLASDWRLGGVEAREGHLAAQILEHAGQPTKALECLELALRPDSRVLDLEIVVDAIRLSLRVGQSENAKSRLAALLGEHPVAAVERLNCQPALVHKLASLLYETGDIGGAVPLFEYALRTARRLGRDGAAEVVAALSGLAGHARSRGDYVRGERLLRLAIRYARLAGLAPNSRVLEVNLAGMLYHLRRTDAALAVYRAVHKAALREGNQRLLPHIVLGLGAIQRDRGEFLRATRTCLQGVRAALRTRNYPALAGIYSNLGELMVLLGAPNRAYRYRLEVLRIARRSHDPALERRARIGMAAVAVRLGAYDRAARLFELAMKIQLGADTFRGDAILFAFRGELNWLCGRKPAALRDWANSCKLSIRSHRSYYTSRAIAGMARIVEDNGAVELARRLIARAEKWAAVDPCPAISKICCTIQRLRLDYRVFSATQKRPSASWYAELQNCYRTARDYQIVEEQLGALLLHLRCIEDAQTATEREIATGALPAIEESARLLASVRKRYRGAIEPLIRRMEIIPASREWLTETETSKQHDLELRHVALDWAEARVLEQLEALRLRWQASRIEWVLFSDERPWLLAEHDGAVPSLLSPPIEVKRPGAYSGPITKCESRQSAAGLSVYLPLRLGAQLTSLLALETPLNAPIHVRENLHELEEAAALVAYRWLAEGRLRVVEEQRTQLERLREENLQSRQSHRTEQITDQLESRRQALNGLPPDDVGAEVPWVGISPVMRQIEKTLPIWSRSDLPLIIFGESGTGKSRLSRRLHDASPRRAEPFVVENCSALPEPLLEAELFGFCRGAFTDAHRDYPGILARSGAGTLVLDQLDAMPMSLQVRLLRVLESRRYRPVGGIDELDFSARLIVLMGSSPRDAVDRGALRADLYYRVQGFEIQLPPLRDRRGDIAALLEVHLACHGRRNNKPTPAVPLETLKILGQYYWPGNVRELGNVVQRWMVAEVATISPELARQVFERDTDSTGLESLSWREATAEFQRRLVLASLRAHGGNHARTAKALGLTRRHLLNLLQKLGLTAL
ncbi:MAG: sigma 54-interacting transcriptional regulator [Planctomycetota bacterium]